VFYLGILLKTIVVGGVILYSGKCNDFLPDFLQRPY